MVKVFVIIVTYNGKYWYDRCFESLRHSTIPVSVVVVDNASTDDTVEFIKANYPEIVLIKAPKNLGFGQGNNKGIQYALEHRADYVFLLNQDAWIEPNTIAGLIEVHGTHAEYGLLSPMHLNAAKTSLEHSFLIKLTGNDITDTKFYSDLYCQSLDDVYDTKYVNAAAWLLPLETLNRVGGFDPVFFHYGEDDNYLSRIIYHQMKIGICPKLKISHDTERQIVRDTKQQKHWSKELLHELTDVNSNYSVFAAAMYHIRKIIITLCKFRISQATYLFKRLKFILTHSKPIKYSKTTNRSEGRLWLKN